MLCIMFIVWQTFQHIELFSMLVITRDTEKIGKTAQHNNSGEEKSHQNTI